MSRLGRSSSLTIGIPILEDVDAVAADVRSSDLRDMEGLRPGVAIRDIIMEDVHRSRVVYGLYQNGEIRILFGVVPIGIGRGLPWLVATSAVECNPLPFARVSRTLLDMLQKYFPILDTRVCVVNKGSIDWHRWCGFEFDKKTERLGRDEYYRAVRRMDKIKEDG